MLTTLHHSPQVNTQEAVPFNLSMLDTFQFCLKSWIHCHMQTLKANPGTTLTLLQAMQNGLLYFWTASAGIKLEGHSIAPTTFWVLTPLPPPLPRPAQAIVWQGKGTHQCGELVSPCHMGCKQHLLKKNGFLYKLLSRGGFLQHRVPM